jgi:sulfur carrier protein
MKTAPATAGVFLNDQPQELGADATLLALLAANGLAERRGLAAAVNGAVVARAGWAAHLLREGDRVLVIRATQGG